MACERQGIVRVGVLQLSDDADVPSSQRLDFLALFSLRNRKVRELLGPVSLCVEDLLAVADGAAEYPEVGELAHVRLTRRLEDEGAEGIAIEVPDLDHRIPAALAELCRALLRRRHQLDQLGKKGTNA